MTPPYYLAGSSDLYELFRAHYGLELASAHLEMAAIEYLWRLRAKGDYPGDLAKATAILHRLQTWRKQEQADAALLPDA